MHNQTSIYSQQNPHLQRLFEQAGNSRKILCAPLDYAKAHHTTLFCNALGDIVKKPFAVPNSAEGAQRLLEEVKKTAHHRAISLKHVFFGGEDLPSYAQNFVQHLHQEGYLVLRVNAWEAKRKRENYQASSDQLDLLGIAKALLDRRGQSAATSDSIHQNLREITRARRRFVHEQTAVKNRIHTYVDRLFPGFLGARSPISAFSKVSLQLMEKEFSAAQIASKKASALTKRLQQYGQSDAQETAQALQTLAAGALHCSLEQRPIWQQSLYCHVQLFHKVEELILTQAKEAAAWLAQSPGAFLTSIRGVGVVLAAGLTAELGHPWRRLASLCSYCGIVPSSKQTGGPEQPAQTGRVRRRSNHIAKDWLVQSANKIGLLGPEELQQQYRQLLDKGQHADFVMAKRYLRISKDLMHRQAVYLPKALFQKESNPAARAAYYLKLWPTLLNKWRPWASPEMVFSAKNPLGQWRQMVQQAYNISLPLSVHTPQSQDS